MNVVCSICARGGSKGLPGKNLKMLHGKPMIAWSIEQAIACSKISKVFVSTDSQDIAQTALSYGAHEVIIRPHQLSNDIVGKWQVWQHALNQYEALTSESIDILVDLDCTSPLREVSDIDSAIHQFIEEKVDVVFSICEARKNPYFNLVEMGQNGLKLSKQAVTPILRRQDAPKVFEHVASIYVLKPEFLRTGDGLLSGNSRGYDIGQEKSLDVDSEFDFRLIEHLMKTKL